MNEDGTRNFWKADEVHFLLSLIKKYNVLDKLRPTYQRAELYKRIEIDFKEEGYNRTAIQIRYKFKALKSSYNQAIKDSLCNGTGKPSCDFYEELDELFKSSNLDSKNNDTLDSGGQEVKQENPAELVEILLNEETSQEGGKMVYFVEKPTQGDFTKGNGGEAIVESSGVMDTEPSPHNSTTIPSHDKDDSYNPKRKRKELDGDGLLDKFLEYQRKADEKAAKLFREAEERAQDRADARMRESMAILSSTINSLFEKFQSKSNSPYSANIPPSSVTFTFNPQGQISSSNFQNTSHDSSFMHNHHKDHSYSPHS